MKRLMRKDCTFIMEKTQPGGRSIEKELFIKAPPERVFQALTKKEYLESWFLSKAEIDLRPGGTLKFEWGPTISNFGKVLVFDPPHRLSYTWESPQMEPGTTTLTFELTAENDGTLLHFTHSGIGQGEDWDRYYNLRNNGWSTHLKNLAQWAETGSAEPHRPRKH